MSINKDREKWEEKKNRTREERKKGKKRRQNGEKRRRKQDLFFFSPSLLSRYSFLPFFVKGPHFLLQFSYQLSSWSVLGDIVWPILKWVKVLSCESLEQVLFILFPSISFCLKYQLTFFLLGSFFSVFRPVKFFECIRRHSMAQSKMNQVLSFEPNKTSPLSVSFDLFLSQLSGSTFFLLVSSF